MAAKTIKTFKRWEKKYMVDSFRYERLLPILEQHMTPDPHCQDGHCYTIYNVYYDTDNNDVIHNSLSKPYYKEKLRMRSYRLPVGPEDPVFLELKKRSAASSANGALRCRCTRQKNLCAPVKSRPSTPLLIKRWWRRSPAFYEGIRSSRPCFSVMTVSHFLTARIRNSVSRLITTSSPAAPALPYRPPISVRSC